MQKNRDFALNPFESTNETCFVGSDSLIGQTSQTLHSVMIGNTIRRHFQMIDNV